MHFYAGVLAAPFVFLACLTGLIYVFNPQIDRLLEPGLLVVDKPGHNTLPLNQQVAKAMASEPGLNVVSVVPNTRPDETTRVNFNRPGGPEMTYHTAFVNPYTGEVQGSEDMSMHGGGTRFSVWLAQFHGDLGLGEFGRWYSELASLWLVVLTIGGIIVWWQRCATHRKITSGTFWKRLTIVDRGRRPGMKRTMSWHSVIGVWTALLALLFGLTGLPFARTSGPKWVGITTEGSMHASGVKLDTKLPGYQPSTGGSTGDQTGKPGAGKPSTGTSGDQSGMSGMDHDMSGMDHDMSGMPSSGSPASSGKPSSGMPSSGMPSVSPSGGPGSTTGAGAPGGSSTSGTSGGQGHGGSTSGTSGMAMSTGVSQAVIARADFDAMAAAAAAAGVNQSVRFTPAARPGTGWTVAENKSTWPVAADSALMDPKTSQVVRTLNWDKATPTLDKLNKWIMLFHFGRLFGFVGQILFALTMLGVMWITWWGFKMWWQRRPRGSAWRFGKVPVRGAWRRAPKVSLVGWSVLTLVTFWVFPVLAVSTIGFVVLDIALGRIRTARQKAPTPGAA